MKIFVSQGTKTASIRAVVRDIAVQPEWNVSNCVFSFIFKDYRTIYKQQAVQKGVVFKAWVKNCEIKGGGQAILECKL